MAEFVKKLFGKESLFSIIRSFIVLIPAVLIAVTTITGSFDRLIVEKIDRKLEPINAYIVSQVIQNVDKQFSKIKNDPNDVKRIDLEGVISSYFSLDAKYKNPVLDDKVAKIREYYLKFQESKS